MRTVLLFLLSFPLLSVQAAAPERVITIGYGLEAQDALVGNDTTSYYPPEADRLPKVGYQRALSAEGILSLDPDLVILTEEAGPPKVLEQLKFADVTLLVLKAGRSLEDVKDSILKIAEALDRKPAGHRLVREIDTQTEQLARTTARMKARKRVMFILGISGGAPRVAGRDTAANSIITLSGASNVVQNYEGYKPLTPEAAVALEPDVILITHRALEQAGGRESVLKVPGVALTPAAEKGHIIAMDSLLLLGFGPRTVQAALQLNQTYEGL